MAGVNQVTILGRLGRDPEVRSFQNGGKVVNLRVATSERFKDRDGNQQERTEWHSVAIFNETLGDVAEKYLVKGSEVFLQGKLQTRKWQDQAGADRYTTEIVLGPFNSVLQLVGGKRDGTGADSADGGDGGNYREPAGGAGQSASSRSRSGAGASNGASNGAWQRGGGGGARRGGSDLDDDIPF